MTYQQTHWSLADLFSGYDDPNLQSSFEKIQELVTAFEANRPQLSPQIRPECFLEILRAAEEIKRALDKLHVFASISFAADTQDQTAQTLLARIEQFRADKANSMLFFELWWKELDTVDARRLLDASGDFRYYLEQLRLFRPHTLSEPEEKVLNIKNVTGAAALRSLYDSITNRYVFKLEVDGKPRELTRGELQPFIQGPDPELRERAYKELFRVFSKDGPILGQMYQTLVRDWHNENISLRRFGTPISPRNLHNDIPDDVVDILLDVARKNSGLFRRYFRLKAEWLGMKRLRRYDVYAPVISTERMFAFAEAARMVFEAFDLFDPQMGNLARRVFEQHHLDSEIRKGKESGAFCASIVPEMTPYVLLNFQDRPRDVAVMAHELGHAIHSMLASEHTAFTFHPCLPLAETASTFGEVMLLDRLLSTEQDEAVRRDLRVGQMDTAWTTIIRQVYFALFEKQAHEMIQKNASVDELCAAYLGNLKEQFGDAVDIAEEFKWEWVSIPHIYQVPFYVYAYAFGMLLVFALYRQYKAEGESFKPRYFRILAAGGSRAPAEILSEAGIDIRAPAFWQGGFDALEGLLHELEPS